MIKFEAIIDYLEERIKFHKENYEKNKSDKSFGVLHEFEIFLNHFYMNAIMDKKNILIFDKIKNSKFAKLREELSNYYNEEFEKQFPISMKMKRRIK